VEDRVSGIKALGRDHPARDVIGAQQVTRCGSEHVKAKPREFISGEVAIAAIRPLRSDRLRIEIRRENAERAVYVCQVGSVLIKLALQHVNDAGEFAALLNEASDDMILTHAAALCQ
jgi:hypothetical protein